MVRTIGGGDRDDRSCSSRLFGLKRSLQRHCSRSCRFQTSPFCRNTASHSLPGRSRSRTRELAVAVDASGTVWAAGPWGVQRFVDGTWQPPEGHKLDGPAFAVASEDDIVWVAAWDGLYRIDGGKLVRAALEGEPLGLVRMSAGRLFVGGPGGIWERRGNSWEPVPGNYSRSLTDVAVVDDTLWIGTLKGLFELREGKTRRIFAPRISPAVQSARSPWRPTVGCGSAPAAASTCIKTASESPTLAAPKGCRAPTCIACGSTSKAFCGWQRPGAWPATTERAGPGGTACAGCRATTCTMSLWLTNGTAYVATSGGLSILKRKKMTLADKAEHYEQLVRARHVRPPGLVEHCVLREPGNLASFRADGHRQRRNVHRSVRCGRIVSLCGDGRPAGAPRMPARVIARSSFCRR